MEMTFDSSKTSCLSPSFISGGILARTWAVLLGRISERPPRAGEQALGVKAHAPGKEEGVGRVVGGNHRAVRSARSRPFVFIWIRYWASKGIPFRRQL